ncbi:MAG: hypothetical protein GF308_04125 [Candidatus Heimdallarchaeota archaeon]|nr:hypothetical protein [Candidatus Heimdallarchaeota archaeon]
MTRFKLPTIGDKRVQQGLKKQIISVFSVIADEMGPHVESIASPYQCESLFNDAEISILFTAVTMLGIKELLLGELKLIFEIQNFKMKDGRTSKKVYVTVCGTEANSQQVKKIVKKLISSSDIAIKNLESLIKK